MQVLDVVQSTEPLRKVYEPGHPLANDEGMVFYPNVNPVAEMTDMMSASRAFETNVEVLGRVKSMQQSAAETRRRLIPCNTTFRYQRPRAPASTPASPTQRRSAASVSQPVHHPAGGADPQPEPARADGPERVRQPAGAAQPDRGAAEADRPGRGEHVHRCRACRCWPSAPRSARRSRCAATRSPWARSPSRSASRWSTQRAEHAGAHRPATAAPTHRTRHAEPPARRLPDRPRHSSACRAGTYRMEVVADNRSAAARSRRHLEQRAAVPARHCRA